ncbi:UNVERIFIED_CONTAM: hypothetical protein PYX00_000988 [Menopon gallinae]|uniref:Probable U2 small nuclear ribonucleoprotein A' n=1 Tax=Menopon gallinae TaxID=328185 RepID=A0AAW2IB53_9NEOP
MVKLTPDLIQKSMQYINPVKDRELDLRGFKIPVIENLGATLDQFDTIDFSDNDIHKLGGFPLLKRLKNLLLNNNRIVRISDGLEESLPNLESIILTGNSIQELGDIDCLAKLPHLRTLSLLYNPIQNKPHYRLYIAFKIPQLKVLDFCKIKMKEREEAIALFRSKKGKELQKEIALKSRTFVPGAGLAAQTKTGPSQEDLAKIREAISKATTLEEVEKLNRMLQSGQIPGKKQPEEQQQQEQGEAEENAEAEEEMEVELTNGHG